MKLLLEEMTRDEAAEATGDEPHLIRIETRAGHGSGKPTSKIIEEASDVYAFLGHFTGMDELAESELAQPKSVVR